MKTFVCLKNGEISDAKLAEMRIILPIYSFVKYIDTAMEKRLLVEQTILLSLIVYTCGLSNPNRTDLYRVVNGTNSKSIRPVLSSLLQVNSIKCGLKCTDNLTCGGFNMDKDQQTCDLIEGLTNENDMVVHVDRAFFEKVGFDPTDECSSDPCLNGTCRDQGSGYLCQCWPEIAGQYCQIDCSANDTCCPVNHRRAETITIVVPNLGTPNKHVDVLVESGAHGDNWIVLMRRQDGSVNFTKVWNEYKDGFGTLTDEFWIGNEVMHYLTNNGSTWLLRIDMQDFDGQCRYAEYTTFSVDSEANSYTLRIGGYNGTAGDSLNIIEDPAAFPKHKNHNGSPFSTYEQGNYATCPGSFMTGWWFTNCYYALLTGWYGSNMPAKTGIVWEIWLGDDRYLKFVDMKIRITS